MILIRCEYTPYGVEYDGITYAYALLDASKIDELVCDSVYVSHPMVIFEIMKNGGLYAYDRPVDLEIGACCSFGKGTFNTQSEFDSLLKRDSIYRNNGINTSNDFLETALKVRKKNTYKFFHSGIRDKGTYKISFWLAYFDYCTCSTSYIGITQPIFGKNFAYLTGISNVRNVSKEDKRKLECFFEKICRRLVL